MFKLLLLCSLAGLVLGEDPSQFIIGGRDAVLGQFPHMVSIRMQWPGSNVANHGCGGAIITKNWVITVRERLENL